MRTDTALRTAVATLALCTVAGPLRADIVESYYQTSSWFGYEISHMPDFDQRRMGVLANNGNAHCVPTSSFNMIAYAINHGFDEITPGGPHSWQAQAHYDLVSSNINSLGMLMGTTGTDGTTLDGQLVGLNGWLDQDKFTVEVYAAANAWAPRLPNLAQWAVSGSLVSFCFGRWQLNGTYEFMDVDLPQLDRVSGHCVTMNGAWATPAWYKVVCRDPADDGVNSTQSPFVSVEWDLDPITYALTFDDSGVTQLDEIVIDPPPADGLIRLIDGAGIITPKQGYAFGASTLKVINPHGLHNDTLTTVPLPTHGQPPSDLVHSLGGYLVLYPNLTGPSDIYRLYPSGSETLVASVPGGKRLIEGRCLDVYVLTDTTIECLGLVPGNADNDAYEVRASVVLPCSADAIMYDDATDEIVVLCCTDRQVLRYPKGLPAGAGPTTTPLPASIPLAAPCAIDVNPSDGLLWIASAADPDALFAEDETSVPLPEPQTDPNVSFDDQGHIFACVGGGVVEFERGGSGWSALADSDYDVPVEGRLRMRRSRTNFDPAVHVENWDVATPPDELIAGRVVPDCIADLDGDGSVNVVDLLLMLTAWGPNPGDGADLNSDETVNVLDLLLLLGAWGSC